jgi:hypothetical protein
MVQNMQYALYINFKVFNVEVICSSHCGLHGQPVGRTDWQSSWQTPVPGPVLRHIESTVKWFTVLWLVGWTVVYCIE